MICDLEKISRPGRHVIIICSDEKRFRVSLAYFIALICYKTTNRQFVLKYIHTVFLINQLVRGQFNTILSKAEVV